MAKKWLGPPQEPTRRVIPGGTWLQRHPTRYGWDPDVRKLIDDLFRKFDGLSINTYAGHPEYDLTRSWGDILGYNTQTRSFDAWDDGGRGVPINSWLGDQVVEYVFDYPGAPYIAWCIWKAHIWTWDTHKWLPWDDDGTGAHFDHPHFTMKPRGFRP